MQSLAREQHSSLLGKIVIYKENKCCEKCPKMVEETAKLTKWHYSGGIYKTNQKQGLKKYKLTLIWKELS
jgi:hypothetical protein